MYIIDYESPTKCFLNEHGILALELERLCLGQDSDSSRIGAPTNRGRPIYTVCLYAGSVPPNLVVVNTSIPM